MNAVRMNALELRAPRRLAALLALAALLTAAAFLALGGLGGVAQAALSAEQRSAKLTLSLLDDSDNIVSAGSTMTVVAAISFTVDAIDADNDGAQDDNGPFGESIYLQSGGRLRVTGGLAWNESERSVLILDARTTSDVDDADAADDGQLDDTAGTFRCFASTEGSTTTWICPIAVQHGAPPLTDAEEEAPVSSGILIPDGTPDGPITISATVKIDDAAGDGSDAGAITLTDSLTVTVGKIVEVQTATLGFATQTPLEQALNGRVGDPWPSVVSAAAGETRLQLSMLNAGGTASAPNSVASLSFTTTIGRLSVPTLGAPVGGTHDGSWIQPADTSDVQPRLSPRPSQTRGALPPATDACLTGGRSRVCQVDVSLLNSTNSDRILIRVEPPLDQSAVTAIVRGELLATDGRLFSLGPIRIRFAGPAIALDIEEPTQAVLNVATADTDNRDQLLISVGATDARGYESDAPTDDADSPPQSTLKGPDGRTITQSASGIMVDWPLQRDGVNVRDAQGRAQARVTVGAAAASPLKVGSYTLELTAGGLKQTVEFRVASGPADIAIETDADEIGLNGRITLTATLTTAEGDLVTDGTPVTFTERSFSTTAVLVMLSPPSQRTKDGQATVTLWSVAPGRAWVEVESGGVKGAQLLSVTAEPPIPDADQLSSTSPASFSVWLGATSVRVSGLLPQLEGVNSVRMWDGESWLLYGVVDGILLPGSLDFVIGPGATLWLTSE